MAPDMRPLQPMPLPFWPPDLTSIGATYRYRAIVEIFLSFCMHGISSAALDAAAQILRIGVLRPNEPLSLGMLARGCVWLACNIELGILQPLRACDTTYWSTIWLDGAGRFLPWVLSGTSFTTFILFKFLFAVVVRTISRSTLIDDALQVLSHAVPHTLSLTIRIIVFCMAWARTPRFTLNAYGSVNLSLSKILAYYATMPLEWYITRKKTLIQDSFIKRAETAPPMTTGNPYLITPLRGRQIRLLVLCNRGDGDIVASLSTVSLDGAPLLYAAVSYMWGSGDPEFHLRVYEVDGLPCFIPITRNCADALYALAPGINRSLNLWIDAICINQKNPAEKEGHIPLMGDIFCRASCVFAFPGGSTKLPLDSFLDRLSDTSRPRPGESSYLFLFKWWRFVYPMMVFLDRVGAYGYFAKKSTLPLQDGWLDEANWVALRTMIEREYFRRAWVTQEIVLATLPYIVYGNKVINLNILETLATSFDVGEYKSRIRLARTPSEKACVAALDVLSLRMCVWRQLKSHAKQLTVAQALHDVRHLGAQSAQPRDRIFSLLALCSDSGASALQPVYDSLICDWTIFTLATIHSFQTKQAHLLLMAGFFHDYTPDNSSSFRERLSGLPSWSPDFTNSRRYQEAESVPIRPFPRRVISDISSQQT